MLLANQITIFFNCQYLITDFDFLHVDRHEWKKNGILKIFLKILSRDKSTNLDLLYMFFFLFFPMKAAKRYMKFILMVFQKNLIWGEQVIFTKFYKRDPGIQK